MSVTNIRVRTTSARAKPASASAASMIANAARAWPPASPGWSDGRPARRRSSRRPSTSRRRRSPGCSPPTPPTGRRDEIRRRHARSSSPVAPRPARAATPGPPGRAPIASEERRRGASSAGTIESTSRYSAGRVVVAADRAEPVEATGRPCPAVVLASEAPPVEASASSKPSAPGERLARARRAGRDRSSFSIGHQRAIGSTLDASCRGPPVAAAMRADRGLGRLEGVARRRPGRRPRACTARRRRSAACRRRSTPTLTVTPGQRPLSAWRSRDDPGRLEDRAAALLRLDAGVRRAAVDRDPQVEDALARPTRCRRWRGRTRGRGTTSAVGGERADVRASTSASRSPRPGWRRRRAARTAGRRARRRSALSAYRPASRPPFMSVTPGP